ncbi:MAG: iron-sulfur cluster assembly accessory protein [Candidatus Heimdallarchaeota archaeon]|nr:iron-sulfur cluster assembly accessory protein [Candidatus Heimdallarchaeota archaeon]
MSTEQTVTTETSEVFVTISQTAIDQVNAVISQQDRNELFLRLFVQSAAGGISFGMALDTRRSEDDHVCFYEGIEVAIDRISFPYLDGANVDFVEGEKSGFQITSPNSELLSQSSAGGGCGSCTGDSGCC